MSNRVAFALVVAALAAGPNAFAQGKPHEGLPEKFGSVDFDASHPELSRVKAGLAQ